MEVFEILFLQYRIVLFTSAVISDRLIKGVIAKYLFVKKNYFYLKFKYIFTFNSIFFITSYPLKNELALFQLRAMRSALNFIIM